MPPANDISALNLLIVDDHATFRGILSRILKDFGFSNVDQAANPPEATEKLKRRNEAGRCFYNVAFFDLHMPGGSGWELLEACRADKAFDDTAILIVSADGGRPSIEKGLKLGATDYVV